MRNFAEDRELVGNKAKGPISKRVFQENKARQNKHFLPPDMQTYVAYQGIKNVRFSENLTRFVFLKHPFWDSILSYYRQINEVLPKEKVWVPGEQAKQTDFLS